MLSKTIFKTTIMHWSPHYQLRDNSAIYSAIWPDLTHAHNRIRNTCEGKTSEGPPDP